MKIKGGFCTYHNPILTGMHPDPSIVRVGDDYYMVNSSFIFFPCIPISHSKDLIHWRVIGHAITNREWARLDTLEGGRGYWGPDISYYDGRFYIAATYRLNDGGKVYRKQMITSSSKPEGPYEEPVFLDEDGIDPSIFTDDDGRRYVVLNRGARIFEITPDGKKQISKAELLYYGDYKKAPEGSHLLKKDGYQVTLVEHVGTDTREVASIALTEKQVEMVETIAFRMETRELERSFFYRMNEDEEWQLVYTLPEVTYLCDEGIRMGKRFTGAMVGVYAFAGEASPCKITFSKLFYHATK